MKQRLIISVLTALAAVISCTSPLAADCGRVRSEDDITVLSRYLAGEGDINLSDGDINGDGTVDSYDLVALRKQIADLNKSDPAGTWIGTGFDGVRVFTFSGGRGTFFRVDTFEKAEFTYSLSGNILSMNGGSVLADITRSGDESMEFSWRGIGVERFIRVNEDIQPYPDLSGTYVVSRGGVQRECRIKGMRIISEDEDFFFIPHGNELVFCRDNSPEFGQVQRVYLTRTDKHHFSITYPDGTVDNFTRREIVQTNGITYVNGILIANKTYALPQTYDPQGLTAETMAAFNEMKSAAYRDGLTLNICSGYRSYSYQNQLYNSYVARDGKDKADTYSARPGHSEHQTGLAADINYAGDWFNTTREAAWLAENCYKYGFIIRYPQGKQDITGYKYESWHVRYLGRETAKMVYDSGLTLEEYLCIDSVYKY